MRHSRSAVASHDGEGDRIRGNSHMIMQDRNNLQIADLILKWIDERVGRTRTGNQ